MSNLLPLQEPSDGWTRILHRMLLWHRPRPGLHLQPNRLFHALRRKQVTNLRRAEPSRRVRVLRIRQAFAPEEDRPVRLSGVLCRAGHRRASAERVQLRQRNGDERRVLCERLRGQELHVCRSRIREGVLVRQRAEELVDAAGGEEM